MLRRLPERSVDVIVTSPPYNLGIRYRSYDDTMPRAEVLSPEPGDIPPKLPEMCLRGFYRARLVADPFLGLGSTAVACAEVGVSFIGSRWTRAISSRRSSARVKRSRRLSSALAHAECASRGPGS